MVMNKEEVDDNTSKEDEDMESRKGLLCVY